MNRLCVIATVFLATLSMGIDRAMTADLPYGQQPTYQQPLNRVASAWQGFYVGVHAGYSWGNLDATLTPAPTTLNFNGSSIQGGLFTGLNFQVTPQFLVGVEGDINFFDLGSNRLINGQNFQSSVDWQSTIRARAGLTFDNYFAYLTGGLAITDLSVSGPGGTQGQTQLGWAIGAGLEGRITDHIFARGEYIYTNFGSDNFVLGAQSITGGLDTHTLRAGIGYRF